MKNLKSFNKMVVGVGGGRGSQYHNYIIIQKISREDTKSKININPKSISRNWTCPPEKNSCSTIINCWFATKSNFDGVQGRVVITASSAKIWPQVISSDSDSYFLLLYVCCNITDLVFQHSFLLHNSLKHEMKREIQYLRKIYLPAPPPPNAKGGCLKVHRQSFFPQAGGSLEAASYSLMLILTA